MGNEQSTLSVGNEGTKRRWLVRGRSKSPHSLPDDSKKTRMGQDDDDDEHITHEKGLGRMPEHVVSDLNLQGTPLIGMKMVKTTSGKSSEQYLKLPTWTVPIDPTPNDINYALHVALKYMFQSNFRSPIAQKLQEGIKVLQINCNAGAWCVDMAREFPASQFTGCHWKASFPDTITPHNCTFQVADPLQLPFEEDTFDFIYQRYLQGPFMDDTVWPKLVAEVQRVAKPGAYIEFVEPDYTFYRCGAAATELRKHIMDSVKRFGIDTESTLKLETYFASSNIHDTSMTYLSAPIGVWAGSLGRLLKAEFAFQLAQSQVLLLNSIHLEGEEFEQLKERALEEVEVCYTYINWHIVYGQKSWIKSV